MRLLDFRRRVGASISDATARTPRREGFLTRRASLPRTPPLSQKEPQGAPIPRGIPRDLVKFGFRKKKKKRLFVLRRKKPFTRLLDFRRRGKRLFLTRRQGPRAVRDFWVTEHLCRAGHPCRKKSPREPPSPGVSQETLSKLCFWKRTFVFNFFFWKGC